MAATPTGGGVQHLVHVCDGDQLVWEEKRSRDWEWRIKEQGIKGKWGTNSGYNGRRMISMHRRGKEKNR